LFVVVAMVLVQAALAQPRGAKHGKPKPSPATADAGGEESSASDATSANGANAPGGAAAASAGDAGPVPAPVARPEMGDGGVKPSPLNPQPAELPPAASPATPDYDKLLGDVSALRARVAAVTDTLFRSRIAIALEANSNHAKIARCVVSLDDGVVYTAPANTAFDGAQAIYEHGVAPGRHAVTVDVDRRDDRDETFRTSQRSRFLVDVPKDERLQVQIKFEDDSTMAGDFPSDKSGRYDLRIRAKALAKPVGK
jgi:hypothetical protein